MGVFPLSKQTVGNDQDWEVIGELKKTDSMEWNKNTLELKMARAGPVLTNFSHLLEAVMLKAAKERVNTLSRSRTTDISWSKKDQDRERDDLPNTTSLSSRKGRLISFGIWASVPMVGRIAGVRNERGLTLR